MSERDKFWKHYDAKTDYPDVTSYIIDLIRVNKKLEQKLEEMRGLILDRDYAKLLELVLNDSGNGGVLGDE